jgi:hypothetical protein
MRNHSDYASDGRKAFPISRALFDNIVATLCRSPRIRAAVPATDLELMLADVRRDFEKLLVHELRNRIHVDDLEDDHV